MALRQKGLPFVYLKATQGLRGIDPTAASYAATARKAGLKIGLYHFFDPAADPVAQAEHFVHVSHALGATLPPLADFEPGRPGQAIDAGYGNRALAFLSKVGRDLASDSRSLYCAQFRKRAS